MSRQEEITAAVKERDGERVKALLREESALAETVTEHGSIVLTAVYYGAGEALDALLAVRTRLDILEAAALGRADVVREWLMRAPALIRAETPEGHSALGLAAFMGHAGAVEALLAFGADVNALSNSKASYVPRNTVLHAAIAGGCDVSLVELLLAHRANVHELDSNHHTPLQTAAWGGNVAIADRLIAAGADVRAAAGGSLPALVIAEERGHAEFADRLRRSGAGA